MRATKRRPASMRPPVGAQTQSRGAQRDGKPIPALSRPLDLTRRSDARQHGGAPGQTDTSERCRPALGQDLRTWTVWRTGTRLGLSIRIGGRTLPTGRSAPR